MEVILLNMLDKIESIIEDKLEWDVNDNADIAFLKSDEDADLGLCIKSHKIYLISKSTSKDLICSSEFESTDVFAEVVANLYTTFCRHRINSNNSLKFEQFISLVITNAKPVNFTNSYEYYYLMKWLSNSLKDHKDFISSVDAHLESLVLHRVQVKFCDKFGKAYKLEVYYDNKMLHVYLGNKIEILSLGVITDWTLYDITEHITEKVIKSLRNKFGYDNVQTKPKESGVGNMRLVALKRDNTLVGFRFKGKQSYDISVDVAKKFGITSIKTSTFISLENSNGLLLSKSEIASGTIVKDVSDDLEFVEKLVKAIGGTTEASDNSEMTVEKMKQIIEDNVDFGSLKKNSGICEFYSLEDKSLGVSYEDGDDGLEVYIYNIFLGSEYLNIGGNGTSDNPIPNDVLSELVSEWNKHMNRG